MSHFTSFPAIGQRVRFGEAFDPTGFGYVEGQVVTITEIEASSTTTAEVWFAEASDRDVTGWPINLDRQGWLEPLVDTEPEPRTIAFTDETRNRSAAREYALANVSRKLGESDTATLTVLGNGEPVEIIDAQHAIVAAFSTLNRHKLASERTRGAKQLRHLYHIVGGAVSNVVRELPVVEQNGAHSPALAATKAELAEARQENENRNQQLVRIQRDVEQRERELSEIVDQASTTADLLTYTLGLLTTEQRQRVEGFKDALTR